MKRILMATAVLLFPSQGGQRTVVVPIENQSFESASALPSYPADPCGVRGLTVPAWNFNPDSGVFQPNSCGIALPPEGKTVAYAGNGATFYQILSTKPAELQQLPDRPKGYLAEGAYTLKFSVANYFPSYPGYYEAKISFGTQELCETTGWGTRNFTKVTLTCPSPSYIIAAKSLPEGGPVQGSANLAISFTGKGWILLFDKVSLEFTPSGE